MDALKGNRDVPSIESSVIVCRRSSINQYMPTRGETTRLTCQKHKIVHRSVGRAPGMLNTGMNTQQYVHVRPKALGAVNRSNCHTDSLSQQVVQRVEAITLCDSDGRYATRLWPSCWC